MSLYSKPIIGAGGGGSGLTPEQLEALASDTDLNASRQALLVANASNTNYLAEKLDAGVYLNSAAIDAIAALVRAAIPSKKGREYRYPASKVPTGYHVQPYYAGATQYYDTARDVRSDALVPSVYTGAMTPYTGFYSLTFFRGSADYTTATAYTRDETSINSVEVTRYSDTTYNPPASGQVSCYAGGTTEVASFTFGGAVPSPGYALVVAALKGSNTGRNIVQFYNVAGLAAHRAAPGDIRIYLTCSVGFDDNSVENGVLFFATQSDGAITRAKFLPGLNISEAPNGVHSLDGQLVLTDYLTTALAIAADGTPTSLAIDSQLSFVVAMPTPLGNKVYGVSAGELHSYDLSLTYDGSKLTGISVTNDQLVSTLAEQVLPCRRGTKMFLLGPHATYVLDNVNPQPKLHQLTHPLLLAREDRIVYPACVYRQNDVDVVMALSVAKVTSDPTQGFPTIATAVAYNFDAAHDLCIVAAIEE